MRKHWPDRGREFIKNTLENVFGGTLKVQSRRVAGKAGAKAVGKLVSKSAAKAVARTAASPWLLASDAAELAAERIAVWSDCDEQTTKAVSKGIGLAAAGAIGGAVGGPPGIAAGVVLWWAGEFIGWLLG